MANTAITTIIKNPQRGHATIRFTANDTIVLADLATPNTATENVTSLNITDIFWTGDWKITRNGNTVFQTANNQGHWDLVKNGIILGDQATSNIVATTVGTTSTMLLSVAKNSVVLAPEV